MYMCLHERECERCIVYMSREMPLGWIGILFNLGKPTLPGTLNTHNYSYIMSCKMA